MTRDNPETRVERFVEVLHRLEREALDLGWTQVACVLDFALKLAIRRALQVVETDDSGLGDRPDDSVADSIGIHAHSSGNP